MKEAVDLVIENIDFLLEIVKSKGECPLVKHNCSGCFMDRVIKNCLHTSLSCCPERAYIIAKNLLINAPKKDD